MKTGVSLKNRQGGAVAVMVGISMVLLIGLLAMVIDLGHLYIVRTGLQNAADAAALSGAEQLNGKLLGVNDTSTNNGAVQWAIATAAKNNYDFSSNPVNITIANIKVGDCPDDGCMVDASTITTDAAAVGKTFLQVRIDSGDMIAYFAPIWNIFKINTFGMAVAGKYVIDITPLAICKLNDDPTNPNVTELGYERGVSYNVAEINPLGGGNKFWLDPQEMSPSTCVPNHGSEHNTLPYVCTGKITYTPVVGKTVYLNTGKTVPQLDALNSRFDDYPNDAKCDPATAPPDTNVKEYLYADSAAGSPSKWMKTNPVQQSITVVNHNPIPWNTRTFLDYGVLWSYSRPEVAAGDANDANVSARWGCVGCTPSSPGLYHAGPGEATLYPQTSPYAQSGAPFFLAPSVAHPGKAGRRVLNMVIVDCPTSAGSCEEGMVRGIGKFIMQSKATNKDLYVEFAGLLPNPMPTADIRLYR